jgi:hypothetical protein
VGGCKTASMDMGLLGQPALQLRTHQVWFGDQLIPNKVSSLGRYVFGSEISYNKAPPRLPGLGC